MNKKELWMVLGIASTYIGTVIGAGYASGQEILQYFSFFREDGVFGIAIATVLFFIFGYFPVYLGNKLGTDDYVSVINPTKSALPKHFADTLITLSLFGTLTIMLAGAGTLFTEQFNIPIVYGSILMCVFLIINTFMGLAGIVKVLFAIVPFMIIGALFISIYAIINPVEVDTSSELVINSSPLLKTWFMAAVLYVSFNLQLAIAVLVPLGKTVKNKKIMFNGILLGSLVLGTCALTLHYALDANIYLIGTANLPMVILAGEISRPVQVAYSFILVLGLYSTAISCFFGSVVRLQKFGFKRKISLRTIIFATAFAALIASSVGFTDLVGTVYPLLGYGGIIIMILIIVSVVKQYKKDRAGGTN